MFKQIKTAIVCIAIGILGRLLPHIPNVTPLLGLSLFSGANLPRWLAFVTVALTLVISDAALAIIYGYPIFSAWTIFTYTGFAAATLIGTRWHKVFARWRCMSYVITTSLGFWLWTNFGVWLTSALYPKTMSGLGLCYVAALPFLRNAMIGDIIWGGVFFGLFVLAKHRLAQKALARN